MNPFWSLLIAAIWEYLGAVIKQILDDLLQKGAATLGEPVPNAKLAVEDLFDAAWDQTNWYQFRTRARLKICKTLCVRHAGELWVATKGGTKVVLSEAEAKEVASAL